MSRVKSTTISDKHDKVFDDLIEKKPWLSYYKPPFIINVIGSCKSGKTHFAINLLKQFNHYFDYLGVYVGTKDQNKTWLDLKTKHMRVRVMNTYNPAELKDFIETTEDYQQKLSEEGKPPLRVCLVFDDFNGFKNLMNKTKMTTFDTLVSVYRHLNISILICSQVYKALSPNIRSVNMSHVVVCGLSNKEVNHFCEEHANEVCNEQNLKELYRDIRREGVGNCMMINYNNPLDERIMYVVDTIPFPIHFDK